MKKFIFLFFILLSLCVSCDPPSQFPRSYHLPNHYFSFIPEKDIYKIGDTVQVKIVIPKKYSSYIGGQKKDITTITLKFYNELVFKLKKNEKNNINFLLNAVSVEEGKITFVYDQEKEKYFLKDKISIVFLRAGEFKWDSFFYTYVSSIMFPAPNINTNNKVLFMFNKNKTFKVEP